jgi:tetratricopeptide (TPR) repeat protein
LNKRKIFISADGLKSLAAVCCILVALIMLRNWISNIWSNLGAIELARIAIAAPDFPGLAARYQSPPVTVNSHTKAAGAFYQRALQWQPRSSIACAGLGRVNILEGRYPEGASNLNSALQNGDLFRYGFLAGSASMYAGQRGQGLKIWMAASEEPQTRLLLVSQLFGQSTWTNYHPERWDDSIMLLRDMVHRPSLTPSMTIVMYEQLAEMYHFIGRLEDAETTLRQILAMAPRNITAHERLAWILMDAKKEEDALREANVALAINPGWRAHYIQGSIHLRHCRLDKAAEEFRAGLKYSADEYQYYWQMVSLGDVYWDQGETKMAEEQWQRYLSFQPEDRGMRQKLLSAKMGDLKRSIRCASRN